MANASITQQKFLGLIDKPDCVCEFDLVYVEFE